MCFNDYFSIFYSAFIFFFSICIVIFCSGSYDFLDNRIILLFIARYFIGYTFFQFIYLVTMAYVPFIALIVITIIVIRGNLKSCFYNDLNIINEIFFTNNNNNCFTDNEQKDINLLYSINMI